MERIEVELQSTDPEAVEATRATLKQPPLNSDLEEKDGKFYIVTSDPSFIRFAVERQGYVKRIVR